ncbi:hypothetical protein [Macrococcus carouselicus]|uniref:Uncharacterized protein n=1 Tax=Macrococcus carouselicus TaxID=69969 RepID=A0A9Q8CM95_9STAP|nr:hypothetical protein [Macrococcus carouselicus]TDM04601.1 hypothetical protein ERX40_05360 [Macrococcus carouselicus]
MPYFEFLIAVKKKDISAIDQIMADEIYSSVVESDGTRRNLDRPALLHVIENKVMETCNWDFDIVYKTNAQERILAFIEVSREIEESDRKEKVVWFMTFHRSGKSYKLVSFYTEELE